MASSSSSLVSSLSPTFTTSSSFNVNNIIHLVSIKLDHTNFLLWKSQFLAILCTHDLMGYIDGTLKCPPEFIVVDQVSTANPEYHSSIKQDQQLASWIMATLSESLLSPVIDPNYTSAHSLWSKLESHCVSASKLHIIQLCGQLQSIKKGSTPMTDQEVG